jgi:hypothetical protein
MLLRVTEAAFTDNSKWFTSCPAILDARNRGLAGSHTSRNQPISISFIYREKPEAPAHRAKGQRLRFTQDEAIRSEEPRTIVILNTV